MWFLTSSTSGKIFFFKKKKTTVGRKGTDFEIPGDESLSRNHGVFTLNADTLKITDESKYGTSINGKALVKGQETIVNDGNLVAFGRFGSEWIVHRYENKTMLSMLEEGKKKKLMTVLSALDVKVLDKFDSSCTHLTMPSHTEVSHKLLQALSSCIPVVTAKYWADYLERFNSDQPLPKCLDYVPKIKEEAFISPDSVSLMANPERRKLFAGKTFAFISKTQMEMYADIIKSAGGKCVTPSQVKNYYAKNTIVIKPKESNTQSQNEEAITKIGDSLKSKNRRMVSETEIGIALLHCSVERYCNPDHCTTSLFEPSQAVGLKITRSKILIEGTEIPKDEAGPSTSRGRGRPLKRKADEVVVIESVNLSSDEEVTAGNKENIPSMPVHSNTETQLSVANDSLPETQFSVVNEPVHEPTSNAADSLIASEGPSVVAVPKSINIEVESEKEQQIVSRTSSKAISQETSSSSLFNFTNVANTKPQRKRKNVVTEETSTLSETIQKLKDTVKEPVTKRSKKNQILDSDEEIQSPRASRKRPVPATDGLFAFKTNLAKKAKPSNVVEIEQKKEVSGIIQISKVPVKSTIKVDNCYDGNLVETGVWLSKRMLSINMNNSPDGEVSVIKSEPESPPDQDIAMTSEENFKPAKMESLFNVIEKSVGKPLSSSTLSNRKQFVKKLNFKPQDKVVTTQSISVEATHESLDKF